MVLSVTVYGEAFTTMTIFSQVIGNMKSRMNREVYVRFCGKAGVKFPCLTRLLHSQNYSWN